MRLIAYFDIIFMKIIFIGSVYPFEREEEIRRNSKGFIDDAANNLQWALLEGLDCYYKDLKVLSQPAIGTYPINYRKVILKSTYFSHKVGSLDFCLGFINIPLLSHVSKTYILKKRLNKIVDLHNDTTLFVYALHSPFLKAALDLKRRNPRFKICLIVPDLPNFMSESKNLIYRFFKSIDSKLLNNYLKGIDAFILLSENMCKPLRVGDRPWIRLEGIFNKFENIEPLQKEEVKTILYTGALKKGYGIINLLDAFEAISNSNFRLWICGEGSCRREIEERTKSDSRINYLGQLPRYAVLRLQRKATLLVNPRTSGGEFTRYSFPSKMLEYMASGTPCLIHRLPGIPTEYYTYVYVAEREDSIGLSEKIIEVCNKDQNELNDFGAKAFQFVRREKNPVAQGGRIADLVKKIYQNK